MISNLVNTGGVSLVLTQVQ